MTWKQMFALALARLMPVTEDILNDPEDCENLVQRGVAHMELLHFEAALADFNTAIEVCKANPGVNHNVDQGLFFARRASLHRLLKRREEAYFDISTAIEIDPEVANYHRIRGDWWKEDGFLERALHDYDSAILHDGSMAALYYNRALILLDLKHFDLAMKNLELAIQLDPTNAEYYCTRGRVYTQMRNIDAALKDLECAVALNNNVSQYFHWRGRLHREKDDLNKALDDFERAVELTGDDIDFSWRSIAYAQLKLTGAALRDIDKAIDRSPNNSFHHQYKGILNYGLGRYTLALAAFSQAIFLLPNWSAHYIWRAAVYYDLRDYKSCLADLDRASYLSPLFLSALLVSSSCPSTLDTGDGPLFWRGILYLRLGEPKKAMYDLKASLKESKRANPAPDALPPSRTLFWLGIACQLLGEVEEANQMLNRVLLVAPSETSKASRFSEPARAMTLANQVDKAKELYAQMLAGNFAVDSAKTEQSHLDLLVDLYPDNKGISEVRDWFFSKRKTTYTSNSVMIEGSDGAVMTSPDPQLPLSSSYSIRAKSIHNHRHNRQVRRKRSADSGDSSHTRSSSY